mmetsp:Transcript_26139/g.41951  ORF Transcript_26139/g.41951 Transcript_26139/m.41951 type:complete len:205 (+) Transcript_26139:17-631(+)
MPCSGTRPRSPAFTGKKISKKQQRQMPLQLRSLAVCASHKKPRLQMGTERKLGLRQQKCAAPCQSKRKTQVICVSVNKSSWQPTATNLSTGCKTSKSRRLLPIGCCPNRCNRLHPHTHTQTQTHAPMTVRCTTSSTSTQTMCLHAWQELTHTSSLLFAMPSPIWQPTLKVLRTRWRRRAIPANLLGLVKDGMHFLAIRTSLGRA